MAETLVLARLAYETGPVTQGAAVVEKSSRQMEGSMGRLRGSQVTLSNATTVLTSKMFSLHSIVTKLGLAFGVAGIVFTLANALKSLVTDLIESTDWFKRMTTAMTDWYNAAVKGETGVSALTRKVLEITKGTGIKGPFDTLAQIEALKKAKTGLEDLLNTVKPGTIEFGRMLLQIRAVNEEIEKLANPPLPPKPIVPAARVISGGVPGRALATPASVMAGEPLGGFRFPEEVAPPITQEAIDKMMAANSVIEETQSALFLLNEEAQLTGGTFEQIFDPMAVSIAEASANLDIMQSAVQGLGSAFATAFIDGGKNLRKNLAEALKSMAIFYAVQAAANLAMGLAASSGWGQILGMGSPATYFAAARRYSIAAALAGVGAAALGGGGSAGSSGGGGGGGGFRGGGRNSRGDQSITVNVNGWVGDEAALGREVVKWIREAGLDGAEA